MLEGNRSFFKCTFCGQLVQARTFRGCCWFRALVYVQSSCRLFPCGSYSRDKENRSYITFVACEPLLSFSRVILRREVVFDCGWAYGFCVEG